MRGTVPSHPCKSAGWSRSVARKTERRRVCPCGCPDHDGALPPPNRNSRTGQAFSSERTKGTDRHHLRHPRFCLAD